MICDSLASDSGVHHIKYPFLVARIMIKVRSRRGWRVRSIFVEMNFGIADWQVHELGREPRQTQQKPEQQFPDVYQRVRQRVGRTLDALRILFSWYRISCGQSSVLRKRRRVIDTTFSSRWNFARIRNMSPESETGFSLTFENFSIFCLACFSSIFLQLYYSNAFRDTYKAFNKIFLGKRYKRAKESNKADPDLATESVAL